MIPRKKLDIRWSDLFWALGRTFLPDRREAGERALEEEWDPHGRSVVTLSVRSAFDMILTELALPEGSEILMSAVTIGDMATIAEAHGLVVVPVDLDMDTLAVTPESLRRAWSPAARILVVAHLFGSRMPLDEVEGWCRRRGVFLVEDAAQSWTGDGYRGHPGADVALFSFGPIKTNTALGGGLARFRDPELAVAVRARARRHPPQPPRRFRLRVLKYLAIQALLLRPVYAAFVRVVPWLTGTTHDAVVNGAVRGFAGGALLQGIRHRPCGALVALLRRRLQSDTAARVEARVEAALGVLARVAHLPRPGRRSAFHSHWVIPVEVDDPEEAGARLRAIGVDATRGASSLRALPPPEGSPDRSAPEAARVMRRILYLPGYAGMPELPAAPLAALDPPTPQPRTRPQPGETGSRPALLLERDGAS